MKRLTHAVPGALMQLLRGAALSDGKVTFAWNAAVGPALERVTTVKLEGGVLIVEAASAEWSREIQRSHGVILARLQSLLGKTTVSSIIVRPKGSGR
jgi:predicted nucleic acid-binding Zn ribbon protein